MDRSTGLIFSICAVVVWALVVMPSSTAFASTLRGHAVVDETIVPGEPSDIARVVAFVRARFEVVEQVAKALQAGGQVSEWTEDGVQAFVADHVTMRVLRELEQQEGEQLHVLLEAEGVLDTAALSIEESNAGRYGHAREQFERLHDQAKELRQQVVRRVADSATTGQVLSLERLDIDMVGLACFGDYRLAGEGYCRSYRLTAEDDYRLVRLILDCGGEDGWRAFSPIHRIAAFFSTQLQALHERQTTPEQVISRHLQHKQWVLERFPYVRQSSDASLLSAVEGQAPGGTGQAPVTDWPPAMVMAALEKELALWRGITTGWNLMRTALGDDCRRRPFSNQLEPTYAQEAAPGR